ncbi:ribosomal L28e/Mak16 [Pisolithus croceorrhizus]|nr:ribosomal L28e/Mak16 [Pisolithus croceorrhizus]
MSTDLQWLLLRNYNSFIVKKGPEGRAFSAEPGNLRSLHSHKFSGLANAKTIDIRDSGSGIQVTTRKSKASPHAVRPARTTMTIRNRSGPRRALGIVSGLAKRGYRPDLRTAALARTSALIAAQNEKKPAFPKKKRGKKAAARS